MAEDEKPYRVYRGGRQKGKVPAPSLRQPGRDRRERERTRRGESAAPPAGGGIAVKILRRLGWRRSLLLALGLFGVLLALWAISSWNAVSGGMDKANKRLPSAARRQLAPQDGLLFSKPTTILLLGTDSAPIKARSGDRHSDSIELLRTDPSHHRLAYLTIPRDLYVHVPGLGNTKINAAYQAGGPALALATVHQFTGLPINHVIIVDFSSFKELIDSLGGVTINVPSPILSNRFDCPFKTAAACSAWPGWRFHKGRQTMDGKRALVYSRIRENLLNPRETDMARAGRQQAVLQATMANMTSFSTMLGLPWDGGSLVKPLTTDLSTTDVLQLGWVKFRSSTSSTLYCRLGGDTASTSSGSAIIPSEDNRNILSMWTGASAPQRPTTTYGPGCAVGHTIAP
ncbi:MAG: hypothetical protein F2663_06860 [Actinobacteria bacterium]|nr:hypothetical protein [Actinomycetota bacterium]